MWPVKEGAVPGAVRGRPGDLRAAEEGGGGAFQGFHIQKRARECISSKDRGILTLEVLSVCRGGGGGVPALMNLGACTRLRLPAVPSCGPCSHRAFLPDCDFLRSAA